MIDVLGEKMYDTKEVCEMFKIKIPTLRKFIKAGAIIPVKMPPRNYFPEAEVKRFLEYLKYRKQ